MRGALVLHQVPEHPRGSYSRRRRLSPGCRSRSPSPREGPQASPPRFPFKHRVQSRPRHRPGGGAGVGAGLCGRSWPLGPGQDLRASRDWWKRFDRRLLRGEQCSQAPKEGAVWGRVGQGGSCRLRERDAAGEAKRHRSYLEGPCCVDWHPRQLENPTGRRR